MVKLITLKNDWKQITREPIMIILFLCPVLIAVIFRLLTVFLMPVIFRYFNQSFIPFMPYALSLSLIFCPMMLGIVMGFMMLDDKDGKIIELMSVTPLTKQGYMINRLLFIVGATILHTTLSYIIMGQYIFTLSSFLLVTIILSTLAIVIGLVFFSLATDKIKGLTYAKGLNLIVIFTFADLLKGAFIKTISLGFPTYWLAEIVQNPNQVLAYLFGFTSCLFWLIVVLRIGKFRVNE
ncbi:hypothetical protein SANA_09720 [Gottschalkiaceae bacterium SANA]|nr:hypothetical protein SANA_09720 [Gottschalkiaceae bacterium SANA]